MSVLSFERYDVPVESREAFDGLLSGLLDAMRDQPGLLWADGGRSQGADGYVVMSEWRTAGDLDAWETTAAVRDWEAGTDPLLAGDPTRRRFAPA